MTKDEIKAFGEIYGILNSVLRLSVLESRMAPFDPVGYLPKALTRRMKKINEETNLRIAEISARISPNAGGRLTQEQTGIFWIGFYTVGQNAGRPTVYDDAMVSKTVRMPAALWEKAASRAGQEGTSVSEVIRRHLEEYAG